MVCWGSICRLYLACLLRAKTKSYKWNQYYDPMIRRVHDTLTADLRPLDLTRVVRDYQRRVVNAFLWVEGKPLKEKDTNLL